MSNQKELRERNDLRHDVSLKRFNTLRLDVRARRFIEIDRLDSLCRLTAGGGLSRCRFVVLGGGSNVLFTRDYDGLVIKIDLQGKRIVSENEGQVVLEVAAGESWPQLVEYAVANGWGGIENLALIPGTAGAAPVQNIAAYGQNLEDCLESLQVVNIDDGLISSLTVEQCRFGYRDSVFKNDLQDRCIIVGIRLRLAKRPQFNTAYRSRYESIEDELSRLSAGPYTIRDVYQAVVNIRRRKLPDIDRVGSAGSFFKNPVISRRTFAELARCCPGIHCYPVDRLVYPDGPAGSEDLVRVPAAWLIQELGLAGARVGECMIWPTQPLNIVNKGHGRPDELLELMTMVVRRVREGFGIELEPEVRVIE